MYSKMQYKLLLVISPHPVTKTAIVPQNSMPVSKKEAIMRLNIFYVVRLTDVKGVSQHQVSKTP